MDAAISFKIFLYVIIIASAIFHEYFHGWAAFKLGDPTAKYAGRLTLNPIKHIDPLGTILVPFLMLFFFGGFIGWAKPVPYNPYNLQDRKYGSTKVALAGPLANLLIALVFGLILRFLPVGGFLYFSFSWITYINIFLALFNLIPVPPLDGSKLIMDLFPGSGTMRFLEQSFVGIFLALALATTFLPRLVSLFYYLFVGNHFLGLTF